MPAMEWHEAPHAALSDLLTIQEKKVPVSGHVAIVGDLAHSRVARSNIYALTKMGAKCASWALPMIPPYLHQAWGHGLSRCMTDSDFRSRRNVIMLRLQLTFKVTTWILPSGKRQVIRPDFGTAYQRASKTYSSCNQAKRHLRKFNGMPKAHFHLFLKECDPGAGRERGGRAKAQCRNDIKAVG